MMTYKKFVESAVDSSATEWLEKLTGESWHVYSRDVRLERTSTSIMYEVDFELVKAGEPWIRREYTVGGAIGEYTGICNSVIFGESDKYGCRKIVWCHNKELRDTVGITDDRFIPC